MEKKNHKTKADRKKLLTRAVCIVLAGLMVGTIVFAAVFSRVY